MKFVKYFDKSTYPRLLGTDNNEESLTDQSFKYDSDINELVARYSHGLMPRTPVHEPIYDMDNYNTANWTFEDWQNQKALVERKFLHLSPEVRAQFGTPAEFFKYCSNPENYELTPEGVVEKPQEPVVIDTPTTIPEPPKE